MCNVDGSLKLSFTKSVMYLRSLTLHSQEKVEKTGFIQYHVPFPRTPYILTCIVKWGPLARKAETTPPCGLGGS